MHIKTKLFLLSCILVTISVAIAAQRIMKNQIIKYTVPDMPTVINSPEEVVHLFPKNVETLEVWAERAKKRAQEEVAQIIQIKPEQRTFENTVRAYDIAEGYHFAEIEHIVGALALVSPDDALRNAAYKLKVELKQFSLDLFGQNKKLYQALNEYVQGPMKSEKLTPEQRYLIKQAMEEFERLGLHLPDEKQEEINVLMRKMAELTAQFGKNINDDTSFITATKEELAGLDEDFINSLPKDKEGKYVLKTIYPVYFPVMEQCLVRETRKRLLDAFVNRAYPQNEQILKDLIAVRDELAQVLGFKSYAEYNIAKEMAGSATQVRDFLNGLVDKVHEKAHKEVEMLAQDLPEGVALQDNKILPWDYAYIIAQYKKKHYNIEDKLIAEYFPLDTTFQGLLDIYQVFFNIEFIKKDIKGLWDPHVKLVEVRRKDESTPLGYLLLDLFPRPNKFSHACQATIIPGFITPDGKHIPCVALVIANFPEATADKPALFELDEVRTFFHEFGHAIHAILGGQTKSPSLAGTSTKIDFVEMPSQMLEEWLWDADILKKLSKHYKTGQPLPDEKINTLIKIKNLTSGLRVLQQLVYGFMSLNYYGSGQDKDLYALMHSIRDTILPYVQPYENDHKYASFGHLTGYGACYYSYLWSQVFALDLFDYIKQFGLLNPEIGKRYQEAILSKGGTQDPNELLKNFLGRTPRPDAFFKDLGL